MNNYQFMKMILTLAMTTFLNPAFSLASGLTIETDPATFAFKGYAGHLRYQPSQSPWIFSLGAYSLEFPKQFRDLAIDPSDDSIDLKLKAGFGIFIDRYVSDSKEEGLFAGIQFANHNWTIKNDDTSSNEESFNTFLIMPRIGYRFNLTKDGLYLLPWVGIGSVSTLGGQPVVFGQTYKPKSILPFATVHLGYEF